MFKRGRENINEIYKHFIYSKKNTEYPIDF